MNKEANLTNIYKECLERQCQNWVGAQFALPLNAAKEFITCILKHATDTSISSKLVVL